MIVVVVAVVAGVDGADVACVDSAWCCYVGYGCCCCCRGQIRAWKKDGNQNWDQIPSFREENRVFSSVLVLFVDMVQMAVG